MDCLLLCLIEYSRMMGYVYLYQPITAELSAELTNQYKAATLQHTAVISPGAASFAQQILFYFRFSTSLTIFHFSMYSIGEGGLGTSSHPPLSAGAVGKEEPSMREEWMEKISDIRFDDMQHFCPIRILL